MRTTLYQEKFETVDGSTPFTKSPTIAAASSSLHNRRLSTPSLSLRPLTKHDGISSSPCQRLKLHLGRAETTHAPTTYKTTTTRTPSANVPLLATTALGFSFHRELYAISDVVVDKVCGVIGVVAPAGGVLKDACPHEVGNPWRSRCIRSSNVPTWVVCDDIRMGFHGRGVAKNQAIQTKCTQLSSKSHTAESFSLQQLTDLPPRQFAQSERVPWSRTNRSKHSGQLRGHLRSPPTM